MLATILQFNNFDIDVCHCVKRLCLAKFVSASRRFQQGEKLGAFSKYFETSFYFDVEIVKHYTIQIFAVGR